METLEFIIYPDGRVKEMVTGMVGSSCEEVTAAIEAEMGLVISREATSEYYQQSNALTAETTSEASVSYSSWT
jgi:fructose/tagatose bisphosphate aldolase